MTHYAKTLAHLVWMAKQDGAKAHAWHRAQVLDADESGLWTGIASELQRQMTGPAKPAESVRQKHGKRP
jgi:hypothetical protein